MGKKIPLRQCVGCREMKTKKEMIRVIKTPENEVVLDAKGKQNGRGECNHQEYLLLSHLLYEHSTKGLMSCQRDYLGDV